MFLNLKKIVYKFEETITIIAFISMTLVVLWSVICRYLIKIPFTMGEELARYLMIYCIYFGVSMGVRRGSHLGVEAFVGLLPKKGQKFVGKIEVILTAIMFVVLLVLSILMMMQFKSTGQVSTMMRIPMYIVYLALPIGLGLSSFHAVENAIAEFKKGEDF